MKSTNRYSVPALEKSLAIVETLANSSQALGMAELIALVDLPKTSVFAILSTLEDHGYIEKTLENKYRLTLKISELGNLVLSKMDIREIARPVMRELADQLGFTVHLASLVGGKAVYIEKVQGPSFVQFSTHIGQSWHLHNSGVGKAIAAFLPKNNLDLIIQKHGLPETTPNTITSVKDFYILLESVRQQGFSIEDEEGEIGVRCLAAPVFDRFGNVIAALGITSVRNNLPTHQFAEIGQIIITKANQISEQLGYKPEQINGYNSIES